MIDPESYFLMLKKDDTMHFAAMRDNDELRYYDGGIYAPYAVSIIREKIMKVTHGAGVSKHRVGEIVALITWDNYVDRDAFDTDPNVINMGNGLYNIKTGISPHTPEYLSLHKNLIKYDPDATCPAIDKFISELVPPEYVQTIYEIGGYAMAANKNLKRAFLFVGEKNSGKTKLLALLRYLVGNDATNDVSPLTVSRTTFGAAEYYGAQLNIVGDLGNTPIEDTGILKSVISSERINAQFKNKQPFNYTPHVLCIFATNQVPKVEPFDEAFASRFSIIPFPNFFEAGANADPDIMSKITTPSELSGFFNKCVHAYIAMIERGTFTAQKTLTDDVKAYQYQSNPVEQFIDEMCGLDDPDAYVFKDTLYRAYTAWSEDHHCRIEKMKELTIALTQHGCVIKKRPTDENDWKRAYIGAHFKHEISDFM